MVKNFFNQHAIKYLIGFATVFVLRLVPFRVPNVEPVMATMLPFAKRFGAWGGFFFGVLSIVLYDAVTSGWGVWTLVTALTYGLLGALAHIFFKNRESTARNYVVFAVFGTLLYDALTGLTIGPLVWNQSFMVALTGQIPFTLFHLVGNVTFAATVSPVLYRWVVANEQLTVSQPVLARL
jgi:uncharacterized membrane protein